ncbi:Branched-chain-amino-acid aminotransferase, cytosolic [Halotydeus destructor]|nr:Branched-chain-amino-acid aminotransferase, cytosolic [Halotydeus destructor]
MALLKCSASVSRCLSSPSGQVQFERLTRRTLRQIHVSCSNLTFKFDQLQISTLEESKRRPKPDFGSIAFGQQFTDHMLEVLWDEKTGWQEPHILPLHSFSLHPAAKVLHYAQELFEGMKAFRGYDDKIRLFRPELNMARMAESAARASFAPFDTSELMACIRKLIEIEQDWVPDPENYKSLYMRPTMIGIEPTLGVASSKQSLLYVILSPVAGYFAAGIKPVNLIANPDNVRAWPGGCGDKKLGSNYGPTVLMQKEAEKNGYQQVLWLYGKDHQVTEVGTMNIFVYLVNEDGQHELITPPLEDGLILPGVTRNSVLAVTREWNEFLVTERRVTMGEILKANKDGRLLEMFGAGTACCVCPVGKISFQGDEITVPTMDAKEPLNQRIMMHLSDIMYGKKTPHPWAPVIC